MLVVLSELVVLQVPFGGNGSNSSTGASGCTGSSSLASSSTGFSGCRALSKCGGEVDGKFLRKYLKYRNFCV